jgi:hypothetical protein
MAQTISLIPLARGAGSRHALEDQLLGHVASDHVNAVEKVGSEIVREVRFHSSKIQRQCQGVQQ